MKRQLGTVSWAAIGRVSAPFLVMGFSLWLLGGLVDLPRWSALPQSIAALPIGRCLLAGALCAVSLWAVARYDALAHRHFASGVDPALAHKSGFAAIAVAQTAGFGVFTSAAVRWRMLPHIGLKGAMQLSLFVCTTFLVALAFLTALACLFLPAPHWTTLPGLLIAALLPVAILTLSFAPICAPVRHRLRLPSLQIIRDILGWSGLDVVAAAIAFYILIPATGLGFAEFLPVFLLALGAAMLSGAPGGVGPFELTLFALLPQVAATDLVTAILVFRAFYYAVPAVLGVAIVFLSKPSKPKSSPVARAITGQQLAELGILAQNGGLIQHHDSGSYALWRTPQTATLLFDPASGKAAPALAHLKSQAATQGRIACLYKCGARTAVAARRAGWSVARIAQECVVDLPCYDLDDATRRGLRRKLRKARKAGVIATRSTLLPLEQMAAIDAAWQASQGRARGGTMGRFCPAYLATQDVYLAHHEGRLIAYASFHKDPIAPCLDLMRYAPVAADGTMHLLVQSAIETASAEGKSRLSLAAVPQPPDWVNRHAALRRRIENPGLQQFKNSFAPVLRPRYAAAPSKPALVLALADIASEVYAPPALLSGRGTHKQHEKIEVALSRAPWKGE